MTGANIAGGDLTRMAVLALLGRGGPASRATIARELDLSPATVSQVTRRLIQQGVLEPLEYEPSDGGRPGQLLGLVSTAGRAVGVKLAADHLILVDVRLDGRVISTRTEPYDALSPDAVTTLVTALKTFLKGGNDRLLGIGVGVPGVVKRPDIGDVDAAVLGWASMPLGRHLRDAIGMPVLIENDVKAFAVAERLYGRGRTRRSFVVITIGRGVGFACVADGALQRGARGGAGELAHVAVSSDGPTCACGRRGCLEAHVGAVGLVAAANAAGVLRASQGVERLTELADRNEVKARLVYAHAAQRLARATALAIAALDPEVVIIAGEGASSWRHWDNAFRATLDRLLPAPMRGIPVEVDEWDESSWARGAGAIVLATPFDRNALAGEQRPQVLARLHGNDAEGTARWASPT
ncbi:MAG: ROK family protein [Acidimicrobiales bacterium]